MKIYAHPAEQNASRLGQRQFERDVRPGDLALSIELGDRIAAHAPRRQQHVERGLPPGVAVGVLASMHPSAHPSDRSREPPKNRETKRPLPQESATG